MLDFVRNAFRKLFVVFLWLTPIICAIAGIVLGNMTKTTSWRGETSYGFHPALGFFLGVLAGILADIFFGGLIATFLNIDENLEALKSNSSKSGIPSGGNSSGINISHGPSITPTVNAGDSWVCKKCGEKNPNTATSCKDCGSYK